jgi:2-polyprenyl-3-methyl-5-hydroxy-6-metoxy-1,4-benzoquinol methylase
MKIDPEILKYLKGDLLDTSLTVDLRRTKYKIISRENAITGIIKNKDVIHLGCADHIRIINEKIKSNIWLHKLLSDNARTCLGIDIDMESIDYIRDELGYKNVLHADILNDTLSELTGRNWDYAVFGEIIEHLDNPVSFLRSFREKYSGHVQRFIITVPNIYNIRQFRNMLSYKEIINSDHRFWFTPYTVAKVLVSAGYIPETISYANLSRLNIPELIIRKIRKITGQDVRYPFYYFRSIIVDGRLREG